LPLGAKYRKYLLGRGGTNLRIFALALSIWIAATAALAEPMVVDGISQETYERSIREMADTLSETERETFAKGLVNLILTRYPPAQGAEGFQQLQFMQAAVEAAHISMNGVTREEILARGREIEARSNAAPAAPSASDTGSPEAAADRLLACLQGRVTVANAQIVRGDFGRYLQFEATNGLSWPISSIWLSYRVTSEGRLVPWHTDDVGISIPGGIEPSETRQLAVNIFMTREAPEELSVETTVTDVDDYLDHRLILPVRHPNSNMTASEMTCE
jgi:hypothetical protein